jgi:hypothetical protein
MLLSQPLERLGATEAGRYGTPSQLQALGLQRGPFAVRVEAAQQCKHAFGDTCWETCLPAVKTT